MGKKDNTKDMTKDEDKKTKVDDDALSFSMDIYG
jgi:hypothetical protein